MCDYVIVQNDQKTGKKKRKNKNKICVTTYYTKA